MAQINAESFTVCQWWAVNNANLTDKWNITILGKMNWPKIVFSDVKQYIEKNKVICAYPGKTCKHHWKKI